MDARSCTSGPASSRVPASRAAHPGPSHLQANTAIMKSVTQIVVLVVVVVGLIAGVTFVSQFNWFPRPKANREIKPPAPPLVLPVLQAQTDFAYELHAPGGYDFWFENRETEPVQVYLLYQSCRCANVQVGIIEQREWREFIAQHRGEAITVCQNLVAPNGSVNPMAAAIHVFREQHVHWQQLPWDERNVPGTPAVVPAARSANEPLTGIVRVAWKGDSLGPQLLKAQLQAVRTPDSDVYELGVRVSFVAPIEVFPPPSPAVPAGEFTAPGQTRTVEFICYSSTRDRFPLAAKEARDDPRFVCACKPLTPEDCRRLEYLIAKAKNAPVTVPVRAAYRVQVTVYERRSEKDPLDIGHFRRQVLLTSDSEWEPLSVPISGMVRGEVRVGTGDDKDRIDLGQFATQNGQSKTIAITTEQAGLELEVADKQPNYLEVRLQDANLGSGSAYKQWDLQVTVPANKQVGRLADSYVLLRTKGSPPRRIRIPVHGNAYRSAGQR